VTGPDETTVDSTTAGVSFDAARAIADAVLLEGYLLYPYRASAQKNKMRWQFGVLTPQPIAASGTGETWFSQTECLLETDLAVDGTADLSRPDGLRCKTRFLQLQVRTVEEATADGFRPVDVLDVDGMPIPGWDEGVERDVDLTLSLADLEPERAVEFTIPAGEDLEDVRRADGTLVGRIRRTRQELSGVLRFAVQRFGGPYPLVKLRVRVENHTPWDDAAAPREVALRGSLLAAHTLLGAVGSKFLSLLEPPWWATPAVEECKNVHTWPVLVDSDRQDVMLSSPIILYDDPKIAPESHGELFDGLENDEILTLRTMALTDEEKRQARGTDPRAAALLDRVDNIPPEMMERLHGAIRELRSITREEKDDGPLPWWDPGADTSVSPETDTVPVGDVAVGKGWRVRLWPGRGGRRADAQDMFLEGRTAVVDAVLFNVEDVPHLAVTLENDENAELHQRTGRFLYFGVEEVEPLEPPAETVGVDPRDPLGGARDYMGLPEIREIEP
jgi:hypothetical protein